VQGPFLKRSGEGVSVRGPALGLLETSSVARGLVVTDVMLKRAPVDLVLSRTVSPGKHIILVTGEVADVGEAMAVGVDAAADALVDRLELQQVASGLLAALGRTAAQVEGALAIFETFTVAASLLAADAACKAAAVELVELRLGDGLGGKAYFILVGEQADLEAALLAAEAAIPTGLKLSQELIARPHEDLLAYLRST
jgi:microcompartment protein CcmL/EutN